MVNTRQREWDQTAYINIRRWRDTLLRPFSRRLGGWGVSPTAVSLTGVGLAAATCWTLSRSLPLALLTFLGALVCDALDGALARQTGASSASGKVVDHACDTATFLLVLLAVARSDLASPRQAALSASLAVPLLLIAIQVRRRRHHAHDRQPVAGFFAHLYKAPIYAALLLYTAGGVNIVRPAVELANLTGVISLVLLTAAILLPRNRPPRRAAATARPER